LSFFVRSSNNREYLLNSYYLMAKHLNTSYSDFMSMPTFEREFLCNRIIEINTPSS